MSDRRTSTPEPGPGENWADLLRVALRNWETVPAKPADPVPAAVKQRIGHYQLLEKIGEGGFGLVWRAWQTGPVRRHVALKIIKLGMDSEQVVARFNLERQTLAMMDHRSIASVYDAGATESGRPYFVMELVNGPPLCAYCDKHRLDLPARLRLFVKVCRGVQHAHQKGVIHRDLKPGNILVTEEDGLPQPKIIDFGVARALDNTQTAHAGAFHTRADLLLGTPEYMSPEQAITGNPDLDTRADIYSLGVILYELLTGRTPLEKQAGSTLASMLQSVRRDEPPRPSQAAAVCSPAAAAARACSPHALAQRLGGDLDWIVLKALAKNREERYESADALALDLERHLDDLPVSAGRPGLAHAARKFIRRNRALSASISVITLTLLAGITLSTKAYLRESAARAEADALRRQAEAHEAEALRQRDLALRESNKAGQTLTFLNRLLEETGAQASQGKNPEALRLALDQLSSELDQFSDEPDVQESVAGRAAMIYRALRDEGKALPLVEKQVLLLAKERAANDPDLLSARENYARALYLAGRLDDSHHQYDLIISGWESRLDTRDGPRRLFLARRSRVDVWFRTGRLAEALAEIEDIKAGATEEMRGHSSWPVLQRTHAEALTAARLWSQAEEVYNESLGELNLKDPAQQHAASMLHSKRATLCLRQHNIPAAVTALERAIELQTQAKGPLSPWLPEWLIEVSRLHTARNQNEKAIAACRAALEKCSTTGQDNRLHLAHRALGDNLEAACLHEEAAAAYAAAAELEKQMMPAPPEAWVDHARQMRNLALCGRLDDASKLAAELEPVLAAWLGDPGRTYDVRLAESALLVTRLASAEAHSNAPINEYQQDAGRLARPVIESFAARKARDVQAGALRVALDVVKNSTESPFQASPLTTADASAFDRALNERWRAGDVAAQLIELGAALRLCGRHLDAAQVYQIAAGVVQQTLPVLDRRHSALLLAAETRAQTGDLKKAQAIIKRLRLNHDSGTDPVGNPLVLAALKAPLSPSTP